MTGARRRALLVAAIALLLLLAAAAIVASSGNSPRPRAEADKPVLLLLTSLPIVFGEEFSLDPEPAPALTALRGRYRVVPISTSDSRSLGQGGLLLMAHPHAQTPDNLVSLDRWVRAGGGVLLLADPMLEWPSKRPLGDVLRPPPMFADTGLLGHWALRLDAPAERGPAVRMLDGSPIETVSPGMLYGGCAIAPDRLTARCGIGNGRAVVIADADFIRADPYDSGARRNLNALLAELGKLEQG
ncbi:MAG TPA: hypothetical protein VM308_02685 [Sphingomicrobium sp.]|nr:hypothetical protein [Sphingomicrobium sp.]